MHIQPRDLTDRQREVLLAVLELSRADRGPSLKELGERVGLASTWAVRRHLDILERRGFIARTPKTVGGIKALSVSGVAA
jgi:SOS-response transcriptional repressor LexA